MFQNQLFYPAADAADLSSACTPLAPPLQLNFDLARAVDAGRDVLAGLRAQTRVADGALQLLTVPDWARQQINKQGAVRALAAKLASGTFMRRRPDDASAYEAALADAVAAQRPLQFRLGFGPLKNLQRCGPWAQQPDAAEFLTFAQVGRFVQAMAALHAPGVSVQVIPDDCRARFANNAPEACTRSYIAGLQQMVATLGLSGWLKIESGQCRVACCYEISRWRTQAEADLTAWRSAEPELFAARWTRAVENARENIVPVPDDATAQAAAWRYLIATRAEELSGLWDIGRYLPLRFGRHAGFYQLYTLKENQTLLPWQISLPWPEQKSEVQAA